MRSIGECQQRAEGLGLTPLPVAPAPARALARSTSCSRGREPTAWIVCRGSGWAPGSLGSRAYSVPRNT
jgi:hypothetical protein